MAKTYALLDDSGRPIDAHVSFRDGAVIVHSRGGIKGQNVRNADYAEGLRVLLGRLEGAAVAIEGAWLDSSTVQSMPLSDRNLLSSEEGRLEVDAVKRLLTTRMKTIRVDAESTASGGSSTRRILIQTAFKGSTSAFAKLLNCAPTELDTGSADRLPVEELNKVTAEHVWTAVQQFISGNVTHAFGVSVDYDLIADDGSLHPPKAVFGVALGYALPSLEILPRHFVGGEHSPSFRLLRAAGYQVVRKDGKQEEPDDFEAREWREGRRRLAVHRAAERGRGLSKAKKAQFLREHGRLFCQRCNEEPVKKFGTPHAEACIEVHNASVQVSEMVAGHRTTLADLQCLCANCHRLVHRLIKRGDIGLAGGI